jgi:hypothetical protein
MLLLLEIAGSDWFLTEHSDANDTVPKKKDKKRETLTKVLWFLCKSIEKTFLKTSSKPKVHI